jgi:hypothetical protein
MAKITNTNIAPVAKKATDAVGLVTVIDVKRSFSARIVGSANRASAILCLEKAVVFPWWNSVVLLPVIIAEACGIYLSPLGLIGCSFTQIGASPFVMPSRRTGAAVNAESVKRSAGFEESGQRFFKFALRTAFEARRKIERMSLWHKSNCISTSPSQQGAF